MDKRKWRELVLNTEERNVNQAWTDQCAIVLLAQEPLSGLKMGP